MIHAPAIYTRRGDVHPCGTPAVRNPYAPNHTRTPRAQNWDPATLRMLPRQEVTCEKCLAVKR
jgi:hypothetical protein